MRRLVPQRPADRWVSIALSVLLHGALLAALVYGWLLFRRPPRPAPTLAIEATVVDSRTARGALRPQPAPPAAAPNPAPAQPPPEATGPPQPAPEATGPPQPTPEELEQREQQRQQAEAAAAEQRRLQAEKAAAEQAAAAAAAAAAQRKALEAQKRADEQKRLDAQKAAEEQKRADAEQERLAEEDLKRNLAAEEQARTERSGPARAEWLSQIQARIQRAWIQPPTARTGIECRLEVTQVPGGTVTKVSIGKCNGDQAVRDSIEAAVYRASPLPPPPDPSMFDPVLQLTFKPD